MLIDQLLISIPPPPLHWLGMSIINYKTETSRLLLGVCCAHGLWNEKEKKMKKISLITTSLKQPQTLIQTWHGEPGIHKKLYQTAGHHHFLQNQQFYPRHLHEANLRLRKIGNFHKKNNNKRKKEKRLCKFLTNCYCQHSTKERYSLFPYTTNKDFQGLWKQTEIKH